MKLLLLAIVASLSLVLVKSSEPSSSSWSIPDLILPFTSFRKLREYMINIECVRDSLNEVMIKSDMKNEWKDTTQRFDRIVDVDWTKCLDIENAAEQEKCKTEVIDNAVGLMKDFLMVLLRDFRFDLVNQIRITITNRCFGDGAHIRPTFFDNPVEIEELSRGDNSNVVEQFQCLVSVLGNVSKDNGLSELWSRSEPVLQYHLNNWRKCSDLNNKLAEFLCNIKESVQVYKLITEYIRLATVENPQIGNLFASEYRRSCASIASIDELFSLASGESELLQSSDHLKCIIETVSEVVAETEVAKLWIKYHKELERSYERIKACKTLSGQWEITKCIGNELQTSYGILTRFYEELKQAQNGLYEKIIKELKEKCFK